MTKKKPSSPRQIRTTRRRSSASASSALPAELDEVAGLFGRVVTILDQARASVVRSVNNHMVLAYWHTGREIFRILQGWR